ncbi:MAG: HAD family hydrolase [Wenzhouxiangella sp.]
MARRLKAVLFDLDGTLVDSAPDLVASLAWLRAQHGLPAGNLHELGQLTSRGAAALIEAGFADRPDLDRERLRQQFLAHYADHLWHESRVYEGIEVLLDAISERGLALAVVTNKLTALAQNLVREAGLAKRFGVLVGGGCTPLPKPHPAPVLEACRRLGVAPFETWMVGDDRRDIESGRRAGALGLAAAWGYLAGEDPYSWAAHRVLSTPGELQTMLEDQRDGDHD